MFLIMTMVIFCCFISFHILYIFIPLYTSRIQNRNYPSMEKGISVIVPAFNESLVIEHCLNGILNVNYNNMEILFVNDGSTDGTLTTLYKSLQLIQVSRPKNNVLNHARIKDIYNSQKYPYIWLIDKQNGGKADSLNAGIEYAQKEIIITLDADSILDPNSLQEMNRTFTDESIVAAGGLVNIVQGFRKRNEKLIPFFKLTGLIRYQVVQYLTAFYLHKTTQSKIGSITVIAGAFGAFRKSILIQAKGYRKTVGEDMDITLRIQELIGTSMKKKRIVFVPEAICYTECPASLKNLFRQRIRWQKAFLDCIITYRKSFFRKMTFKVSTYLLIDSLLLGTISAFPTLLVPILILFTMNHLKLSLILFLMSFVLAIMQDVAALLVSRRFGHIYTLRDVVSILLFLPVEVILFRLTGLFFVTFGSILYFFNKDGWSRSERIGEPILIEKNTNA